MQTLIRSIVATLLLVVMGSASAETIEMKVNGLVCAFCAQGIEKALRKQPATEDIFVSLKNGLVAVSLKPDTSLSDETLRGLLQEAGYTVASIKRTETPIEAIREQVKP